MTLRQDSAANGNRKFLFFRPENFPQDSLYMLPVDSVFLKQLFNRTKLIVGSGLVAYHFKPKSILAYLYRVRFWQAGPIRINPLGLLNPFIRKKSQSEVIVWDKTPERRNHYGFLSWSNLGSYPIIVGRVFFPLETKDEYFAMDIYYDLRDLFRWNFMTQVLLVLIGVFFLLNSLLIRRMIKFGSQINRLIVDKFALLRKGVRAIASGNLDYHVEMKGEDEFGEFADHFNLMSKELKRFMNEAREKERLDQELKIAHQVQLKMLPETLPEIKGYQLAADLTTANEVGGDFYDIFALDNKRYLIAVGDVSGKGMSAAFYMAQFISLLRYSTTFILDIKKLAVRLNEYLTEHVFDSNIFVTAVIGILDISSNEFKFVRAGHSFPVLIAGKDEPTLEEIQSNGIGLGMTRSKQVLRQKLELTTVLLNPGDRLILYTDGFTEAAKKASADEEGQKIIYGEARFFEQLKKCSAYEPAKIIAFLKEDIEQFYAGAQRFDDQTIVVLKKD